MFKTIYAQTLVLPGGNSVSGPPGLDNRLFTIGGIVSKAIPYIFLFAGVGTLLMILLGGFQLLTGSSDPKQIEMGKQRLTYGFIGFFIIFFAYWVVQGMGIIFGIEEFKAVFPW